MIERPEPGVRGDRDAIVTGQEDEASPDRVLETPDVSTPAGAEHPFEPSPTDDATSAD